MTHSQTRLSRWWNTFFECRKLVCVDFLWENRQSAVTTSVDLLDHVRFCIRLQKLESPTILSSLMRYLDGIMWMIPLVISKNPIMFCWLELSLPSLELCWYCWICDNARGHPVVGQRANESSVLSTVCLTGQEDAHFWAWCRKKTIPGWRRDVRRLWMESNHRRKRSISVSVLTSRPFPYAFKGEQWTLRGAIDIWYVSIGATPPGWLTRSLCVS
jgi:hypothetical protein